MKPSIQKAFILGAGLGTRLRPMTDSLPKPLVPFFQEPLVCHSLRHCLSAGLDSFAINTHHLHETWSDAFPDGSFCGAPIEFFYEEILLETGGGIKNIASFIGDESILVYNGDILTDIDLQELIRVHRSSNNVATLALFANGPNCNVAVDKDVVIDIRNARGIHSGTHQFSGIYCIDAKILDLIPANEKVSIIPAFIELMNIGKVGANVAEGASWYDLGTRQEYMSAHQELKSDHVSIHESAEIDPSAEVCTSSCVVGKGAVIGKGVKMKESIVWPGAVVEDRADLQNCIVRHRANGKHVGKDL